MLEFLDLLGFVENQLKFVAVNWVVWKYYLLGQLRQLLQGRRWEDRVYHYSIIVMHVPEEVLQHCWDHPAQEGSRNLQTRISVGFNQPHLEILIDQKV